MQPKKLKGRDRVILFEVSGLAGVSFTEFRGMFATQGLLESAVVVLTLPQRDKLAKRRVRFYIASDLACAADKLLLLKTVCESMQDFEF